MSTFNHNSDAATFEIVSYFEEVWDANYRACLGTRPAIMPPEGRAYGAEGQREEMLTEPTPIQRGHKMKTLNASTRRPIPIFTRLLPLCGRTKWQHPQEAK